MLRGAAAAIFHPCLEATQVFFQAARRDVDPVEVVGTCVRPGRSTSRVVSGWALSGETQQQRVWTTLARDDPTLTVISMPKLMFTLLDNQIAIADDQAWRQFLDQARALLTFAVSVASYLCDRGRFFVLEAPATSSSWAQTGLERLSRRAKVHDAFTADCRFGTTASEAVLSQSVMFSNIPRDLLFNNLLKNSGEQGDKLDSSLFEERVSCSLSHYAQEFAAAFVAALDRCAATLSDARGYRAWALFSEYQEKRVGEVEPCQWSDEVCRRLTDEGCECWAAEDEDEDNPVPPDEPGEGHEKASELKISKNDWQILDKVHCGLGHPSNEGLVRVLKWGRARAELVQAARHWQCASCTTSKRPRRPRASRLPSSSELNDVVGTDIFFVRNPDGTLRPMLSVVCWGTGLQFVTALPDRESSSIRKAYRSSWTRFVGYPRLLVVDQETGFSRGIFAQQVQAEGTELVVTSSRSPWQAGPTERAGGTWKETFHRTIKERPLTTSEDFDEVVDAVNVACNECVRRSGYSVYARVFGRSFRLPEGSLGEDDNMTMETASRVQLGDPAVSRNIFLRQTARKARIEADANQRWKRAFHRKRVPEREISSGQRVYFWGPAADHDQEMMWRGPALVVAVQSPKSVWIQYRGGLLKASAENLRAESPEEAEAQNVPEAAKEEINSESNTLRGKRPYRDISDVRPPDSTNLEEVPPPPALQGGDVGDAMLDLAALPPGLGADISEGAVEPEVPRPSLEPAAEEGASSSSAANLDEQPTDGPALEQAAMEPADPSRLPFEAKRRRFESTLPPTVSSEGALQQSGRAGDAMWTTDPGDVIEVHLSDRMQAKRKEIKWRRLSKTQQRGFWVAMRREWGNLHDASDAVEVLSEGEAARVRADRSKVARVLRSRWVLTEKEKELPRDADGKLPPPMVEPKARWVLLGHTDPDLATIVTYSPVLSRDGFFVVLQVLASFRWRVELGDVSSAFAAGDYFCRQQGELYAEVPEEGIPGVAPKSLIKLKKAVYGLGDAPLRWFRCFLAYCVQLGFRQSALDPCLLTFWHGGRLDGIIGLSVDDIIGGGGPKFQEAIVKLRLRFPFGKWKTGAGRYCGKNLQQRECYSIEVDQSHFVKQVVPVALSTARRQDVTAAVSMEELSFTRAALGNLSYLARETRCDLTGPVAISQGKMPRITVADVLEANRLVSLTHRFADVRLRIQHIPPAEVAVLSFEDSAHHNLEGGHSQAGYVVFFADRAIAEGKLADVSPAMWRSHKLKRRAVGTIHSEIQGISEGMAAAEYLRVMWQECTVPGFDIRFPYKAETAVLAINVTDSKGGFDHLNNPTGGPSSDRRCAVDVAIARTAMSLPLTVLRWVDGARQQLTDALTKSKGNADLLRGVLACGNFAIVEEKQALVIKEEERVRRKARSGIKAQSALLTAKSQTTATPPADDVDDIDDWQNLEADGTVKLKEAQEAASKQRVG